MFALVCLVLIGISIAQEPTEHAPAIKVQVQQVLVPVVVTDRKGHFITDLKASDFHVFEDGVEQKLAAFTTIEDTVPNLLQPDTVPSPRAGETAAPPPLNSSIRPRHTYLIVVDTLNSALAGFVYVREALGKLFKQEQDVDTQYAVIALSRTPLVVQNLTRDPKIVLAALENKEFANAISSSEASNFNRQEIDLRQELEQHCTQGQGSRQQSDTGCGPYMSEILTLAGNAARERDGFTRDFLMNLRSLTEQLSQMPGRRVMIVASDGFSLQPGRPLFEMITTFTDQPKYTSYDPTSYLSDQIGAIVRLATARNVTFYTLDSRGLSAQPGVDISEKLTETQSPAQDLAKMTSTIGTSAIEKQDPMNFLAQATGGIFYHNSNDLLKGLRQSFADGRSYYELAYDSSNPAADGKYRAIRVQVQGKNLIVRAKPGYWASQMEVALVAPAPRTDRSGLTTPPVAESISRAAPTTDIGPSTLAASSPSVTDNPATDLNRKLPEIKNPPPAARQESGESYYTGAFSVVDLSPVELMADFPELQGLELASGQEQLSTLLNKVGESVAAAYRRITSVVANETVTEQQFGHDGSLQSTLHHNYNYLIQVHGTDISDRLEEYRADSRMRRVESQGVAEGFPYTKGFASDWVLLYPDNQSGSRFRYLGTESLDGRETYVLALAEHPRSAPVTGTINFRGKSALLLYQGLAWIDALTYRVIKLRLDLLEPRLDVALEKESTEINLGEVHISQSPDILWLPLDVSVTAVCNGQLFRIRHEYSKYRLFVVQSTIRF